MKPDLLTRKKQLEDKLSKHGINGYLIKHLPYLEFDHEHFVTPQEAGVRMMILYTVAYVATEPDQRKAASKWLKREKLWASVAPSERKLFVEKQMDEDELNDLLWETESAFILAWSLNLINKVPTPIEPIDDGQVDDFMDKVPDLGSQIESFLNKLNYRDLNEIYDENLFYELATTYFRDLMFNGKEDTSDIDRTVSFRRHKTLNWLRRFMDIEEWDETDTST